MLKLVLTDMQNETDRIKILQFESASGNILPDYSAGAHLDFDLGEIGSRSYSLIDWGLKRPLQTYTIAVQREDDGDGGSKKIHELLLNDTIEASEPRNNFELKRGSEPYLLLAGGIGVTPLISMASSLQKEACRFSFHYTARNRSLMGFQSKLAKYFGDQMTFHFDDQAGIDLTKIMKSQTIGTGIYICGPKGMIDAARTIATEIGHLDENIHVELFSTPETQTGDKSFEVEIHETGEVFTIPVGKTIIEVLEDAGKDVLFDCQRGDCGICQTDVMGGTPDHRDVVLSQADRESGKVMQICVSRARSRRLILNL